MKKLLIENLDSGGLITNYYCSSKCAHCLYFCSPQRSKDYIDEKNTLEVFKKIKKMNCRSVHIGGGEPMLDFDRLIKVLEIALQEDIDIDYVETNSSWYKNEEDAIEKLTILKKYGVGRLLLSISPFHNEYIPFEKVKNVLQACEKVRMGIFPWLYEFFDDVDNFDPKTTHSLEEYMNKYGNFYMGKLPDRYWLQYGGRMNITFEKELPNVSLETILENNEACNELADTGHFHFDVYGNYIPGLCAGLVINIDDLGTDVDFEKYKIIGKLFQKGIKKLYQFAVSEYNYKPKEQYLSKCHLCNHIRAFIVSEAKQDFIELRPLEYYNHVN